MSRVNSYTAIHNITSITNLLRNLKSQQKAKEKLLSDSVIDYKSNVSNVLSSNVVLLVSVVIPSDCFSFLKLCKVETSCLTKFTPFGDFTRHIEVKFSSFSDKLSQAIGNPSVEGNIDLGGAVYHHIFISQDVSNRSFSAPPPVAVRFEHNPQEGSTLSQRGGVEVSFGRAAAGAAPKDGNSLLRIEYRDLHGTIRFFGCQVRVFLTVCPIYITGTYLVVIISNEFNFLTDGNFVG